MQTDRLKGLSGLWYSILGYAACAYAIAHYLCWVLPRTAWLHYSGQLPPPRDPHNWPSHDKEGKL